MFRKKRPTVATAAAAPSWKVYQGEHEGNDLFARFNTGLANTSDRASYPIDVDYLEGDWRLYRIATN